MIVSFEKNGTTLTARPEGRMDSVSSPGLERQLLQEMDGVTEVIMDLERVNYISSGGLRVLLRAYQEMENCGGTMKVTHVKAPIQKIFELVGFMDLLTVE